MGKALNRLFLKNKSFKIMRLPIFFGNEVNLLSCNINDVKFINSIDIIDDNKDSNV
jgi:hypothetical protein